MVSDEKLPSSQCNAATDSKRATKKKNSNNDDVSLQSTNKENVWEAEAQYISDTLVSNLRLAHAHTKQKETTETKEARGVPNLAPTLVSESTKVQVEELLPPQHNAATASKKALNGKNSSKGKDEEQKSTLHPQVPMRNPDANGTHEGLTLAGTKESKKRSADMQSHTQPLPNPNKKRDKEANHALLHENA